MNGLIKICGLRDLEALTVAISSGATAVGFILAPSQRQVTPEGAAALLAPQNRSQVDAVGVVVNETLQQLQSIRERSGLDILQLSGDEDPALIDELDGRVWKALRFPLGTDLETARTSITPWLDHQCAVERILVDAAVDGSFGGTGHRADWELACQLAEEFPIVLAGGLNPENVAQAIAKVHPFGVDVASGVERNRQKSPDLIHQFVERARASFASQRN